MKDNHMEVCFLLRLCGLSDHLLFKTNKKLLWSLKVPDKCLFLYLIPLCAQNQGHVSGYQRHCEWSAAVATMAKTISLISSRIVACSSLDDCNKDKHMVTTRYEQILPHADNCVEACTHPLGIYSSVAYVPTFLFCFLFFFSTWS